MLERQRELFVEEVGLCFEQAGYPRMAGRVVGLLLISEEPQLSLSEIATRLAASRGSISMTARLLLQYGQVEHVPVPGERRDYFRLTEGAWASVVKRRMAVIENMREVAERGLNLVGSNDTARARLQEMRDFFAFCESEWPALVGDEGATDQSDSELRTERTTLKRKRHRGFHDFETISRVLDEALFCHIGFVVDSQPFVVPTGYGRDGRTLYIHGSSASRMLKALSRGIPLCVTVTLLDGLILARSAFRHSMNYRSVMVVGQAHRVDADEKLHGLRVIVEHVARGRWADVRQPTAQELKATAILKLNIEEASAKIREGPSLDYEEDLTLPCWAGEIPFALVPQTPVPDSRLLPEIELPSYLAEYSRPRITSSATGTGLPGAG